MMVGVDDRRAECGGEGVERNSEDGSVREQSSERLGRGARGNCIRLNSGRKPVIAHLLCNDLSTLGVTVIER